MALQQQKKKHATTLRDLPVQVWSMIKEFAGDTPDQASLRRLHERARHLYATLQPSLPIFSLAEPIHVRMHRDQVNNAIKAKKVKYSKRPIGYDPNPDDHQSTGSGMKNKVLKRTCMKRGRK